MRCVTESIFFFLKSVRPDLRFFAKFVKTAPQMQYRCSSYTPRIVTRSPQDGKMLRETMQTPTICKSRSSPSFPFHSFIITYFNCLCDERFPISCILYPKCIFLWSFRRAFIFPKTFRRTIQDKKKSTIRSKSFSCSQARSFEHEPWCSE